MTEANQKILYKALLANGNTTAANDILKVYPHFEKEPTVLVGRSVGKTIPIKPKKLAKAKEFL